MLCEARLVVEFVKASVKAGYREFFGAYSDEVCGMVDQLIRRTLAQPKRRELIRTVWWKRPRRFCVTPSKNRIPSFWFNRIYHQYKTQTKPEADFQRLQKLVAGQESIGLRLRQRLSGTPGWRRAGTQSSPPTCWTTATPEARHLPFVQMTSATDIAYPDDSVDVALVLAVLHHINPDDLPRVIQRLRKSGQIRADQRGHVRFAGRWRRAGGVSRTQPLLAGFIGMTLEAQQQVLALIDFFANAIAQGIPEMNMPFEFKTVTEWEQVLLQNGFRVKRSLVAGFEPGLMHKSCHVWLVCERTGLPG